MSSDQLRKDLISYLPNLRAFALTLCRDVDQADDLVQDTMLSAWKSLDRFEEGTNLRAWLFTILRNAYFSEFRRRKREVPDDDGTYAAKLSIPPSQYGCADMQDLAQALAELPDEQREALILVGAEGFSYEEAAEISNCAVGTIKSRINRARNQLIKSLGLDPADKDSAVQLTQSILSRDLGDL